MLQFLKAHFLLHFAYAFCAPIKKSMYVPTLIVIESEKEVIEIEAELFWAIDLVFSEEL